MSKGYEFEKGLSLTYGSNNLTLKVFPGSRTQSSFLTIVAEELFATDPRMPSVSRSKSLMCSTL